MFELKTLSPEAVPRTLAKAERYRLLNEPAEAESICLDALNIDPDNQDLLVMLLLAITDQFADDAPRVTEAWQTVARLRDDYERLYYTGIIHERRAKALLRHHTPRGGGRAYDWLREAMLCFENAEAIRPPGLCIRYCHRCRLCQSRCPGGTNRNFLTASARSSRARLRPRPPV